MSKKTIGILVVLLLAFYGSTVKLSESNFACGGCHTPQHNNWAISTHKNVDCRECHIDPGVGGALTAQYTGVKNLLVAFTTGGDTLTREMAHESPLPMSSKNCMDCHAAILYFNELGYEDIPEENTIQGQGLYIAHRTHIEKYDILCVECHRGISHRNPDDIRKYKTNWPFMKKDCGPCHTGKYMERFKTEVTDLQDMEKCTTCHPYYVPPPNYDK